MSGITERIIITPNASMSGRQRCCFLVLMSLTCLGIAIGFALQGLWMVLPFAGIELFVLSIAFHLVRQSVETREVVSVGADDVRVETGRFQPEHCCVFQRAWTQVLLQAPGIRGYPSRLLLRSGGKQVEVGACLNDAERIALHDHLTGLVRMPAGR